MTIPLLCLACLALLGWVVLLKSRIEDLNKDITRLQTALDRRLREVKSSVEVSKGRRLSKSELDKGL